MNATETVTHEYVALDYLFSLTLIVLVTLSCAVAMLWALYRERKILGQRTTFLFSVLRIAAIAAVLWMLLAPTSVLEESTSTRKAVAILTDVSASMSTVDPVGTADDLRWTLFQGRPFTHDLSEIPTEWADRAIAALGIAQRELAAAVEALEKQGAQRLVTQHLGLASRAIERTRIHLDAIREQSSDGDENAATVRSLLVRLTELIQSPEYDALIEVAETLQRDRTPSEAGWREGVPDLMGRTVMARRVLQELAGRLLASEQVKAKNSAVVPATSAAGQARIERVGTFLSDLQMSNLASIKETANVRWSCFDQSPRDLSGHEETSSLLADLAVRDDLTRQTDLSAALRQVVRMRQDQPVAATFVFSDVAHNSPETRKPSEIAAQFEDTPVYVIPIGNQSRLRDIDLVATSAPSVAMRNDDVVIEAQLEAYQCLGERCVVQLLRDGQVVDFRNLQFETDSASRSVRFDQRVSEIGKATFQIAVESLDGEMTEENNFGEVEINVTRSDIKVLLADELPRWEYRYLSQLFRRDPKVEVDELLYHPRLIATGRREETRTFPITVDQWDQYDVVILGDVPPEHFPGAAQESLLKYLRTRGGTLIMIAGDQAMPQAYVDHPLEQAIPVKSVDGDLQNARGGYSFRVTDEGRSHVALMIGETEQATRDAWEFVNRFSPLHEVSRWRVPLPTARNLISAVPRDLNDQNVDADSTFLCWQPVGRGRVVYLSGPDTYRLRFLRGDRLHYRFWGQLMRWAIASDLSTGNQSVRIRTAKTRYETDQSVDIEVELLDPEGGPVIASGDATDALFLRLASGDMESQIPLIPDDERPGHYRAEIQSLRPGVYQVQPAGTLVESLLSVDNSADVVDTMPAVATFTVLADLPTELVDTRCNLVLAEQISDLTGGQVLPPTAVAEILELTNLDPITTHRVQRQPLWLRWRYLWLVFGCLQTEWIFRKWRGLS